MIIQKNFDESEEIVMSKERNQCQKSYMLYDSSYLEYLKSQREQRTD